MGKTSLDTLSKRFRLFAAVECHGYTPLYERLSLGIAADRRLLALAAAARPGQPAPNLFLGAVQFLLFDQPGHPLAAFYPSITAEPGTSSDPMPALRDFCAGHERAISELLRTRLVQTNKVRRSACLLPAFATVAALGGGRPLALIEWQS